MISLTTNLSKVRMPLLGLGTYKMVEENIKVAIPAALESGYRLFDTATIYKNEKFVGQALSKEELDKRGLTRSDIFVTSKLQTLDQGYELAKAAIDKSLERLGFDYIDLYLIHWPGASGCEPSDPQNLKRRKESWRALEEALTDGKLRAIGVSNYMVNHLTEMESYAKIMPMVNQIELHPLYYPEDVIDYCNKKGIHVQAYSSLGRGQLLEETFLNRYPRLLTIASECKTTLGQVYLKWALQHGFSILPKSNNPDRIKANADLYQFTLDADQMAYIDSIHRTETTKICWDPKVVM